CPRPRFGARDQMTVPGARRLRGVVPDAFWTFAQNVLGVLGSLAVVRIIASLVPPEQYGQASLSLGILALLSQLIVLPLLTANLRHHFDDLQRGPADFMAQVAPLLTKCSLVMSVLYLATAVFQWAVLAHPAYLRLTLPALVLIFAQPRLSATLNSLEA